MASVIFQKHLARHKQWLDSDGKEGERFNISRQRLPNVPLDLSDTDLREAELFCSASLYGANLSGADLRGAKLPLTLIGVKLRNVNLSGTTLENRVFTQGERKSDLAEANFSGATLINVEFKWCNLQETNFIYAKLVNPIFHSCDLTGTKFVNASLQRPEFSYCDRVDKINFHGAKLTIPNSLNSAFNEESFKGMIGYHPRVGKLLKVLLVLVPLIGWLLFISLCEWLNSNGF